MKVEVEVRAISVKQAKELVQLIESVIVTGVFAQASVLYYLLYYLLYQESVVLTGVFAQASSLHRSSNDYCNNSSNNVMRVIGIVLAKVKVVTFTGNNKHIHQAKVKVVTFAGNNKHIHHGNHSHNHHNVPPKQ